MWLVGSDPAPTTSQEMHMTASTQQFAGTFADYAMPSAADVPSIETDRTETPTAVNSLGARGVGEAGTIACTPAIPQRGRRRAAAARRGTDRHAADVDAHLAVHRGRASGQRGRWLMIALVYI